jgi:hypothetical protein
VRKHACLAGLVFIAATANGQATIETRKLRTIPDRGGKAFSQAPYMVAALPGGRYVIQETNTPPVVIDSMGRLVKRFRRGEGPGEFQYFASSLTAVGDTLYAGNAQAYNVYAPDLTFVRAVRLSSLRAGPLVPVRGGFAILSAKYVGRANSLSLHVVRPSGELLQSFLRDTILPRQGPPGYYLSAAADGNLWVTAIREHRIEKWSADGRRLSTFASAPAWFDNSREYADGQFYARAVESDGILWVQTHVPVADYRKIMAEVFRGRGGEVDGRLIPEHRLFTTRLEAYEVASGRLLAELPINAFAVGFVNNRQFMTYTEGADDQPRLEVWEMRLTR